MSRASETARLARIVEMFASGMSIETIAGMEGVMVATVEAVIRQAMKLADRKGMGGR